MITAFPKVGGHYQFRGGAGRTKRHRKGKLALSWAGTSIFSCPQTLAFLVLRTLDLGWITQLAFLVLKLVVGRWRDVSMTRTHNYRGQEIPYTCQDSWCWSYSSLLKANIHVTGGSFHSLHKHCRVSPRGTQSWTDFRQGVCFLVFPNPIPHSFCSDALRLTLQLQLLI